MADITFLSMPDSAYLWTAMLVADEKGVSYDVAELVYRSPEHLKLHPFGKMPVMQHGKHFIYESLAITYYIDRAFAGPALQPSDALGQADMLRWISIVNSYVFPIMKSLHKGAPGAASLGLRARHRIHRKRQGAIGSASRIDRRQCQAPSLPCRQYADAG